MKAILNFNLALFFVIYYNVTYLNIVKKLSVLRRMYTRILRKNALKKLFNDAGTVFLSAFASQKEPKTTGLVGMKLPTSEDFPEDLKGLPIFEGYERNWN